MTEAEQLEYKYRTGSLFEQHTKQSLSSVKSFDDSVPPPQSRGAGLKYDGDKLRYSLIPPSALKALAEVLTFGAVKYAPNSWQLVENAEERYLDALIRHLEAYRSGERLDPESGLPHIAHLLCNAAFLSYFDSKEPHGS